jgi:hypothetical protein
MIASYQKNEQRINIHPKPSSPVRLIGTIYQGLKIFIINPRCKV